MNQIHNSKKLEDIKNSDFTKFQTYFNDSNINDARMKFKIRSKVLEKIPENFRNK